MKISMDDIRRMTVAERVELISAIWETIEGSQELPALTDAQKTELDRRLKLYESDPGNTKSWSEVRERLERGE